MYIVKYSAQVHMAKDVSASASPPYEGVPNISQYTFNNLLYTFYFNLLVSSVQST